MSAKFTFMGQANDCSDYRIHVLGSSLILGLRFLDNRSVDQDPKRQNWSEKGIDEL
jgi:hypothetical protein